MRTTFRPDVERLESVMLLSSVAPTPTPLPILPPATTITTAPQITITTNHATYTVGAKIVLTEKLTNTSSHVEEIAIGPPNDGFVVAQHGKVVWRSNNGVIPQFLLLVMLKPGQSHTITATWDGHPSNPNAFSDGELTNESPTGTFVVDNQLDPKVTATFTIKRA